MPWHQNQLGLHAVGREIVAVVEETLSSIPTQSINTDAIMRMHGADTLPETPSTSTIDVNTNIIIIIIIITILTACTGADGVLSGENADVVAANRTAAITTVGMILVMVWSCYDGGRVCWGRRRRCLCVCVCM